MFVQINSEKITMSTEKKGKCAEEFKEPYHDDNEGKNQLEKNK
jgi:hypothetical protein